MLMLIDLRNDRNSRAAADDRRDAKAPERPSSRRASCRKAAAAVEFAVVAPILFLLIIIPIIEFGRSFMVMEMLTNAARSGCRVGVLPGNTNTNVTAAVSNSLTGVSGATTAVAVNGVTANCSTANPGDTITVTVSTPYSNISWIPGRFLASTTLTGSQSMRHE